MALLLRRALLQKLFKIKTITQACQLYEEEDEIDFFVCKHRSPLRLSFH